MSTNPDNNNHIGLGPQRKMIVDGEEINMDQRYLIPTAGMLRFIERGVPTENEHVLKKVRILQQYQWSQELSEFDWFDIPLVDE